MDLSRYLGLFISDSREHLARLEADLVRLEETLAEEDRVELLHAAFRHLHSLKGSSATMGFDAIATLAHKAEELIGEARLRRKINSEQIDLLLQTADALRSLVEEAAENRPLVPRTDLLDRLGVAEAPAESSVEAAPFTFGAGLDGPATLVRVRISSKSPTPAARAFLVLRKMGALGEVLLSDPTQADVRAGQLPTSTVRIALKGAHTIEVLREAVARIPDIDAVEIFESEAPAAEPPSMPVPPPVLQAPEQTIRVNAELLDQLLELAGELVLSSGRLRAVSRAARQPSQPLEEEIDRLRRLVKDLNNRVLATRQTPVQRLFERLPRIVRDLSRRLGKPLVLRTEGADVTLDRGLLEALGDPILHALRNAADHGVEHPEERARAGKPSTGQLAVSAQRERDRVIIDLRDDGRGFNTTALREKAVRQGALARDEATALSEEAALRLAFLPGVSTRDASNDISGRGVGMDAVLQSVEQLGGSVVLQSTPGQGSCIRFVLPTTVSVVNLLLVDLAGEVFGLPMSRVIRAVESTLRGQERSIQLNGERLPAHALGRLLGLPERLSDGARPYIVVEGEGQRAAVGVDSVLGQEEVVLRPLGPPLERIRGLAGTAILGSGRPIFVLDVPRLVA
jgi:two-component system chemotaxis sensor kinase CheA